MIFFRSQICNLGRAQREGLSLLQTASAAVLTQLDQLWDGSSFAWQVGAAVNSEPGQRWAVDLSPRHCAHSAGFRTTCSSHLRVWWLV